MKKIKHWLPSSLVFGKSRTGNREWVLYRLMRGKRYNIGWWSYLFSMFILDYYLKWSIYNDPLCTPKKINLFKNEKWILFFCKFKYIPHNVRKYTRICIFLKMKSCIMYQNQSLYKITFLKCLHYLIPPTLVNRWHLILYKRGNYTPLLNAKMLILSFNI